MGALFRLILKFFYKLTGKKLVYYSLNADVTYCSTAVKSKFGFWYAGDLLDYQDIAYGIINNGQVEPGETTLVERIIKELLFKGSCVFYDVGANTGYYGVLAGFLGKGKAVVYSFEPLSKYRECLNATIFLNRLEDSIRVFSDALSDTEGQKNFYIAGSGSSLNSDFLGKEYQATQIVQTARLDYLFDQEKLLLPDFIKIDVEGGEMDVLKGAMTVIKTSKPILFIEIAQSVNSGKRNFININFKETFVIMENFGYKAYLSEGGRLDQYNPGQKRDGVAMYLFLHKEKHSWLASTLSVKLD